LIPYLGREYRTDGLNPQRLVPPVTSTVPSGRIVALACRRPISMEPVGVQAGAAAARSMISAVFFGKFEGQGSLPPPPM
jgi:hypothetical protein